jgi:hypothetical protein
MENRLSARLASPVGPEVLDVTEEEARKLLLTIDPLAALAEQQQQLRRSLLDITPATNPDLQLAWQSAADAVLRTPHKDPSRRAVQSAP